MPQQITGTQQFSDPDPYQLEQTRAAARTRKRLVLVADSARIIAEQARLIHEARSRRCDLFCFTPPEPDAFAMLSGYGVEPMTLPSAVRGKNVAREFSLALREIGPDVLLALSWPQARQVVSAAARADTGRIVAAFPELALALTPDHGDARLKRKCAAVLSQCDAVIVSGLDRDRVGEGKDMIPANLEAVFVPGPVLDLGREAHVPLAPLNKGMVFLAIAYPGTEAGIALYCESARELESRRGNAVCLVVSPPQQSPSAELLRLMKTYRGAVRYLGPRDDIKRLLARAHVIVFPDETPYLPRAIGHALAIGRPIISADVPTRWQAVMHDVNGQRVRFGRSEALTVAMQGLLRRPDLIPRYAEESRRLAITRFDISAIVKTQLAVLRI